MKGRGKVLIRDRAELLEIGLLVFNGFALALDPLVALHVLQFFVGFLEFFADGLQFC